MRFQKLLIDFKKEFFSHTAYYILLTVFLVFAFILRVYRFDDLLGFYYDQGRDALVLWRLWHEGKLFLVGPVTGIEGIFLGPFYYYLIAPFYLIGGGNPVYPAVFLAILSTIAILFLAIIAKSLGGKSAALFAIIISGFSYYIVLSSRWLSNPTPILLTSVLLFYTLLKITKEKSNDLRWVAVSILVGVSMHFESASAIFYLPITVIFAIWQRSKLPSKKYFMISLITFFLTVLPQLLFNFRHDNLLINNFLKLFESGKGFRLDFWAVLSIRLDYFWSVVSSKIFPGNVPYSSLIYKIILIGLIGYFIKKKQDFILFAIFLGVPAIGYILFQGNHGNIYDYYLTGYYLIIILLFSLSLSFLWKYLPGKLFVIWFFVAFFNLHIPLLKNYLTRNVFEDDHIALENQLAAVDKIYETANNDFNVEIYVPPVIPYSYEYLLLWQGTKKCGVNLCGLQKSENKKEYFALYESDSNHPDRLSSWILNTNSNSMLIEQNKFGGITVEKRQRQ